MGDQSSKGSLQAYGSLLLGLAALVTAIGSWIRPADEEPAKKTFEWTTEQLERLNENDVKNHRDIQAIRDYLNDYAAMQQDVQEEILEKLEAAGSRRPRPRLQPSLPSTTASGGFTSSDNHPMLEGLLEEGDIAQMQMAPPEIEPPPPPLPKEDFEKVQKRALSK